MDGDAGSWGYWLPPPILIEKENVMSDTKDVPSLAEAKRMVREMRADGKSWDDIAVVMKSVGFVGTRSGKPLSGAGLYCMVTRGKTKARGVRTVIRYAGTVTRPAGSTLDIVKSVLKNDGFSTETKLAMIELVLEA